MKKSNKPPSTSPLSPLKSVSGSSELRISFTIMVVKMLSNWRATFDELADHYQAALDAGEFEREERFKRAAETSLRLGKQLNSFLTEARAWASSPPG